MTIVKAGTLDTLRALDLSPVKCLLNVKLLVLTLDAHVHIHCVLYSHTRTENYQNI